MEASQQKLESIKIRKLKNLVDFCMDLNGKKVTAILGPNGNGKSTVLHALACAYGPIKCGENHKFSNFFLPNTDALWNDSYIEVYNSYREGDVLHSNVRTIYEKNSRWTPKYARRPRREVFYIGIDKCVPMIELQKKQAKINYVTSSVNEDVFSEILEKASRILNKKYLGYNIHTSAGKDFIGVETHDLRYSALSMSAGEQKVFHLLDIIFNAPKYSLILIEELDMLLHDKAMAELIRVISYRADNKNLQIVFTTHRESVVKLADLINIRHLLSTSKKTLCFNETYPDAINRLTGEQPRPLEIFVEDDFSLAVVNKIAATLGAQRLISVHRFGAGVNCFTAVAGLLFAGQDISNSLFVLDGDIYKTHQDKEKMLKRVITGTDSLSDQYVSCALMSIKQYKLPENNNPELFFHTLICSMSNTIMNDYKEIIDAANDICVVADSHKFIDDIISRVGLDRNVGLSKIVDLVANTTEWNDYIYDISLWLKERIKNLGV